MSGFDFAGMTAFWKVHLLLAAGRGPSQADWDGLFSTPGYMALTASEFSRQSFVDLWLLAYRPGGPVPAAGSLSPGAARRLEHYREAAERKAELVRYQGFLERDGPGLAERARQRAFEFLPPGEYPATSGVAFVIFDRDGRGYVPVVLDLLYAQELGDGLWATLAHEFHHQLVFGARGLDVGGPGDKRTDLQWVLDQIHCEGLADVVSDVPENPVARHLGTELAAARAYLADLDRGLRQPAESAQDRAELGAALRKSLRYAGHPAGYLMADAIRRAFGPRVLASVALDPGDFFALYRRAALRTGAGPAVSEEAVRAVREITGGDPGSGS